MLPDELELLTVVQHYDFPSCSVVVDVDVEVEVSEVPAGVVVGRPAEDRPPCRLHVKPPSPDEDDLVCNNNEEKRPAAIARSVAASPYLPQ